MMKKLLLALLVLLAIPIVHASADVTYNFNQNNVNASVYNCLDSACNQVGTFGGSIRDGPNVTDGTLTIRYPDTLNTHGYGAFFVSKGYRPLEIRATWHTNGNTGIASTSVNYEFTKYPITCRAVVSQLTFVNELQPNVPLVVNMSAKLDAQTASAFQLTNNEVGYVPPEFKQEYYGADTIVKMEVLQSGSVVHSQQQEFSAVKGNSLIADSTVPVQFTYLPTSTGNFAVKVTAQVVDDQCAATEDVNAQGAFTVLQALPTSQFYTILNGLTINNTHPRIGQPVLVSYNKITNHADGVLGPLTPVQTDVDYIVKNGATTIFSHTTTLFENPDAVNPVTYSFTFNPTSAGVYNITVKGRANSAIPTTNPEITDEESLLLTVIGSMSYKVAFNVRNADNGTPIENASVSLSGIGTNATNANGTISFSPVPEGMYTYTITAQGFGTKNDKVSVTTDKTISVSLHSGANESDANTAPFMNLPNQIEVETDSYARFNYHDYVQDDQDSDSSLVLSVVSGDDDIQSTSTN